MTFACYNSENLMTAKPEGINVLLISGSTREPSHTRAAARHVQALLEDTEGVTTSFWDLRDKPLPIADPEYHREPHKHPDPAVRELVAQADNADAYVLATPDYHNSMSGVIKNALDHLRWNQFDHKPVGVMAHGDGLSVSLPAAQLRLVTRAMQGISIPTNVLTEDSDFDEAQGGYQLASSDIKGRMKRFTSELVDIASRLKK